MHIVSGPHTAEEHISVIYDDGPLVRRTQVLICCMCILLHMLCVSIGLVFIVKSHCKTSEDHKSLESHYCKMEEHVIVWLSLVQYV